jgi:hypothetical protein
VATARITDSRGTGAHICVILRYFQDGRVPRAARTPLRGGLVIAKRQLAQLFSTDWGVTTLTVLRRRTNAEHSHALANRRLIVLKRSFIGLVPGAIASQGSKRQRGDLTMPWMLRRLCGRIDGIHWRRASIIIGPSSSPEPLHPIASSSCDAAPSCCGHVRLLEEAMHGLIYLIGLIVVIMAILSFLGLR